MEPRIIVLDLSLVLAQEPGDHEDVASNEVIASATEQLNDMVLVLTDKLVPYRIVFVANPR